MHTAADVVVPTCWTSITAARAVVTRSRVRERTPRYEDEGSVRESRGAVTVGDGAWWAASLTAPIMEQGAHAGATIHVHLGRHGAGRMESRHESGADLLVQADELATVVTLLAGIVSQARRDGVLP